MYTIHWSLSTACPNMSMAASAGCSRRSFMAPRVTPAHDIQIASHQRTLSWHTRHLPAGTTLSEQHTHKGPTMRTCCHGASLRSLHAPTARAQALWRRCMFRTRASFLLQTPTSRPQETCGPAANLSASAYACTTMCCKYSQPTAPLNLHCRTRSNAPSLPAAVRVLLRYMQSFHPQPRLQSSLKVGHPVTPCPPVAVYAKTPACWCMDVCCPDKSSWE